MTANRTLCAGAARADASAAPTRAKTSLPQRRRKITPGGELIAIRAAEERDGVGGLGMGLAVETGPGAALGVPEITLQAIGLVGVGGEHPAKEDVLLLLPGVLEEALAQVHVVAADLLRHRPSGADDLQEIDAGDPGRHGA